MREHDLIGTWRKVAYGDMLIDGLHLLHLRSDGAAITEGEFKRERYSIAYTWRLTGPTAWELSRIIPLGDIPDLEEATVEVLEHTIVAFDRSRMAVTMFDFEDPFHDERQAEPGAAADPAGT